MRASCALSTISELLAQEGDFDVNPRAGSVATVLSSVLAEVLLHPSIAQAKVPKRSRAAPKYSRPLIRIKTVREEDHEYGVIRDYIAPANKCDWNEQTLVLAHGYRGGGLPQLPELSHGEAGLDRFAEILAGQGWAVAATSYRNEVGKNVLAAVQDIVALRKWITTKFERPRLCLLEGRSMGAVASVLIAEGQHGTENLFDGVVAIGAALLHEVATEVPFAFTHLPTVPLLFLTNMSEVGPVEKYCDGCRKKEEGEYPPATWEVFREGHNLVSTDERLMALSSVISWGQHGTCITMRQKEVYQPHSRRLGHCRVDGNQLIATVIGIDSVFRAICLDVQPENMERVGIRQNKEFVVAKEGGGGEAVVKYLTYPFLVPPGTFIAFDNPDGFLSLTVTRLFTADAVVDRASTLLEELRVEVGDSVVLRKREG